MIDKIPILTFHSIDNSGSVISITPDIFQQILNKCKQKNFKTISFDELLLWHQGETSFNSPRFLITFDDGFENLYKHAFPLLNKMGFQATVFLATGYCGKKSEWQPAHIPTMQMLNWNQIIEMEKFGFNFQAHTHTHPRLPALNTDQILDELTRSKKEIEDHLDKSVNFFAYPFQYFYKGEDAFVQQIFKAACTTYLDFATPQNNKFLLPRIDTFYFSNKTTSKIFLSTMFKPYLKTRNCFRIIRQALIK